ncbi:alpha-galactosidase [Streptomyces sp. ACA25]|uniref:glycoside hydrolase family 36 protein n=1 Tax=Streptomyces sp. ACA25 TaxID=3022596 RepID=UPI0023073658|nr:glycoside hydrolase family 36 protein [Streptomyces sp. ACA25]MDB1089832.1 alpha-galactosidase [Streptomyces sp. ACA25]
MQRSVLTWSGSDITLHFALAGDQPVSLLSVRPDGTGAPVPSAGLDGAPLVEVLALGHGRFPGSHRYADTMIGARLRHTGHTMSRPAGSTGPELRIVQTDPVSGLVVTSVFQAADGVPAVRTWSELTVESERTIRLQAVTSLVTGAFVTDAGRPLEELELVHGDSDRGAGGRWHRTPLREAGLVARDPAPPQHAPRSRFALTSRSSWSTGEHLPTGAVLSRDGSWAVSWQIEHNGAWHWELGERKQGAYLALLGPTDTEHQWSEAVSAGRGFTTVPVSLAVCRGGADEAFGALTRQRRALRAGRSRSLPVIFTHCVNTIPGDPTTAELLPLIDAAAEAGADYFCVDAGWYDEDGRWWDSLGEWQPSESRFPGGLAEILERIRDRGMVPGVGLEPEVVGVRSALADRLPDEAFFQRDGVRVVEHGRYHLDLRHPRARSHLNDVVDRLMSDFGVGYLKLDHPIMPGPGTDLNGAAPGAGLLGHNRAHLAWLDTLLSRCPDLLLENCAAGAMRMDYAMLSRLHLQAISSGRNPLLHAPAAAAAPASVLPEQAGNRSCPQPDMTAEEAAFTLATGILGRLHLSGPLDRVTPLQSTLVREAVTLHKRLRPFISGSLPFWPLGLTGTAGPWVATGLRSPEPPGDSWLTLWRGPGAPASLELPVPHLKGEDIVPEAVFPAGAADWDLKWDAAQGALRVSAPVGGSGAAARVIHLRHS